MKQAWGGQEVEIQANLGGRDSGATFSPSPAPLLSSGPGQGASRGPGAPLMVTVTIQGNWGEEKQPPKKQLPGPGGGPGLRGRGLDPWVRLRLLDSGSIGPVPPEAWTMALSRALGLRQRCGHGRHLGPGEQVLLPV